MYFSFLQESSCERVSHTISLGFASLPIIMPQEKIFHDDVVIFHFYADATIMNVFET